MEHHNASMPCTVMLPVILLTMIATKFWRNVATNVRTLEYGATIQYTEPQLSTRDMPLVLLWECGCQGREGWWSASADKISNTSAATWRGRFVDGGKVLVLVYVSLTGRHTDPQHLSGCDLLDFYIFILLSHLPIWEHRIAGVLEAKIWWTADCIVIIMFEDQRQKGEGKEGCTCFLMLLILFLCQE